MAVTDLEENDSMGEKCASQELCCFVAALMHSELAAVRLPTLDYTGKTPQTKAKFQILLEAIGVESPGLSFLHVQTIWTNPPAFLSEYSALGDTLFRVLPRLTNLRVMLLDKIHCDDWALQQFAVHATNLVYGFFLKLQNVNLTLDLIFSVC
jgi:hypothetical protein